MVQINIFIYEDDRRTVAIKTVNWLHYLNYEAVARSLSGFYSFVWGASYGQTVT